MRLGGIQPFVYEEMDDVYKNVVIAIDPARQLNSGAPGAHAKWLAALAPTRGERVLHVGCGLGYYTAILAAIVGREGQVVGIEVDADLARRAATNLAAWPQASVLHCDRPGDGDFDALYVNAGATHVPKSWQQAVATGGRIVMPLTMVPHDDPRHAVSGCGFYHCENARDPTLDSQIERLVFRGFANLVLETQPHARGERCLVHHADGCIQAG